MVGKGYFSFTPVIHYWEKPILLLLILRLSRWESLMLTSFPTAAFLNEKKLRDFCVTGPPLMYKSPHVEERLAHITPPVLLFWYHKHTRSRISGMYGLYHWLSSDTRVSVLRTTCLLVTVSAPQRIFFLSLRGGWWWTLSMDRTELAEKVGKKSNKWLYQVSFQKADVPQKPVESMWLVSSTAEHPFAVSPVLVSPSTQEAVKGQAAVHCSKMTLLLGQSTFSSISQEQG